MNVFKMVLMISLHIQLVMPRRRPQEGEDEESSAESFENLLYFQDCTKKKDSPPTKGMPYSGPQIIVKEVAPQCQQCPAVCYSCCFNPPPAPVQNNGMNQFPNMLRTTGLNSPLNMGQNRAAMPGTIPGALPGAIPGAIPGAGPASIPSPLESPLASNPWSQLRKSEVNPLLKGPMGKKKKLKPLSVLNSFRKSGGNLKGLIEKDDDIKKILRDLVKVTIKKVDTLEKDRNNENDEEFPSSEVIVVQDGEETHVKAGNNNGDENEDQK